MPDCANWQTRWDELDRWSGSDNPPGATREGLNRNIDVGLQYLTTWLRGNGCVPIYNLSYAPWLAGI